MYLSNRLAFSIFSVLLVAVLACVVAPAMAQQTVSVYGTRTDATANADGKWEVMFKFSEGGNFNNRAYFTTVDTGQDPPATTYNISLADTPLTKAQFDAATLANNKLTVTIPKGSGGPAIAFTVDGYDGVSFTATVAEGSAQTMNPLTDYLASRAYIVYARTVGSSIAGAIANAAPVLGTATAVVAPNDNDRLDIIKNDTFPDDLEEFFNVGGGTIDLMLTDTGANSRHIIINEIMWATDGRLVGQLGHFNQQWIEVYNPSVIPVPTANISFRFIDDTFPPPAIAPETADRLSNIPDRQTTWTLHGSSSGTSTLGTGNNPNINGANPAFVSMYRKIDKQNADGWQADSWAASDRAYFPGFKGSPGRVNVRAGLPTTRNAPTQKDLYPLTTSKVIINEVYNANDNALDWIELRNITDGEVNIKDWRLNYTTGKANDFNEHNIVQFKDTNIPAESVLLIVNKDPEETNLAAGDDIREGDKANLTLGAGSHRYLNIKRSDSKNLHIPNDIGSGYLILRDNGDNKFRGGRKHLHDVAGPSRVARNTLKGDAEIKEPEVGQYWKTDVWPINAQTADKPNDIYLQTDRKFAVGKVWARNGTTDGWKKDGGSHAGYMGGIGYDRGYKGDGTPGYHNDVSKEKLSDLGGKLIISELMLSTDNGRYPQWIELHNTSRTHGIDLAKDGKDPKVGWQIHFENHNSGTWKDKNRNLNITINLKDWFTYIPPNQTVLIVSNTRQYSDSVSAVHFPRHRVANVFNTKRTEFSMANRRDEFLNAAGGFYIKITDSEDNTSDEVGNLDGKAPHIRKGIGFDDPHSWNWADRLEGATHDPFMTDSGERTSLIRLKDGGTLGVQGVSIGEAGTPRPGVPMRDDKGDYVVGDMTGMVIPLGTPSNMRGQGKVGLGEAAKLHAMYPDHVKAAWVHAVDIARGLAQDTWYGSSDDYGTPGHTTGTPLPVSLSFFRPTLEDSEVVIRWTTESELDNAGFNILRSDTRNGEFTQVNAQLIQGKGTTAERSTYKWVDTSAKPGAVYYYQIEDVSFAGERSTFTTTKLKGLISAKGKLTTKWGELKEVQ